MMEVIIPETDLCVGCNRCVRECPMVTACITYQDEAGNIKVKIDHEKCIKCGRCVSACKHNARHYHDDTERFFNDLSKGVNISLISAPSTRTNIPGYKKIFTFLKNAGVKRIYDVSLGADICIWAHVRYIEQKAPVHLITQPCPAIVSFCEIYRHDLLEYLAPIHSPMACVSIYMKEYNGVTDKIAALSPCVAKTDEFSKTHLADYNVTFSKLLEYIEKNGIQIPEEETGFDHPDGGIGSIFPTPGGLKECLDLYFEKNIHVTKAEGFSVYEKLGAYAETPANVLPEVFDVLNCVEGCNIGPASLNCRTIFEIDWEMNKLKKSVLDAGGKEYINALYKKFDDMFDHSLFVREYHPCNVTHPHVTENDIQKAFELLGKDNYDKQNIDCHACGSDSCREMAKRIALNVNIPINCIVNAMETARDEHAQAIILEHASKAKSDFLSSMSHEMRTPMNAIIGMAQIAAKTVDIDKLKYCLSSIEESSAHLLGLINDILDMSKIEAGRLELDHIPINIEKMLVRVCNLIIEKIEQKNLKFSIFLDTKMRMQYVGDELRLSQVITNLLSNAVKFTPVGGDIRLTVEEAEAMTTHSRLRFSLKDTGIGISKEQIGKLFNAFEQAESGTTRKFGGTGLGLAISKSIVEKMNGRIWVESKSGEGSTFTFDVMLERPEQKSEAIAFGDVQPSDLKLLIADRDWEARDYFKAIATSFGIEAVDEADNIGKTLDLALAAKENLTPYDVIFVDYSLCDERSLDIVRNSRAKITKRNIIAITSFVNWNKIADSLQKAGVSRFIPKPIFPSSVLNAISDTISKPMSEAIGARAREVDSGSVSIAGGAHTREADSGSVSEAGGMTVSDAAGKVESQHASGAVGKSVREAGGVRAREADSQHTSDAGGARVREVDSQHTSDAGGARVREVDSGSVSEAVGIPDRSVDTTSDTFITSKTAKVGAGADIGAGAGADIGAVSVGVGIGADVEASEIGDIGDIGDIGNIGDIGETSKPGKISGMGGTGRMDEAAFTGGMGGVAQTTPDFSDLTLLIAEDIEINSEILIALLEDTGIIIDVAENGLIAVEKFKQNPNRYDMIIMDVQMPEMDGYAATKSIRALSRDIAKAEEIPIIAMTANVFREDIERCLRSGMNDHLAKPIDINSVTEKIKRYCQ